MQPDHSRSPRDILANGQRRGEEKFTPAGRAVAVRTWRHDGEIRIEVRDEGAGIEAELLPRVFDLFTQGIQSSERSGGGLGLGLSIARSIVVGHEGTIVAESAGEGKGTTITVRLPFAKHEANGKRDTNVAMPDTHRRRVLFVDDNADGVELLAEFYGTLGYETLVAYDGPGALRIAGEIALDAVVLDIGLPGMDGYELAAELLARHAERPPKLVALTGYAQASDRRRALADGFSAHFGKPVDTDLLKPALEELIPKAPAS